MKQVSSRRPRINLQPFRDFFASGSVGGIILLLSVVVSLTIANSAAGERFAAFLETEAGIHTDGFHLSFTLLEWVNDGLMAVFFLLVGLEIKRELVEGELSSPQQASLPVFAAFGGAVLPALIYALLNNGQPTAAGWGVPMATDIAFAIGILSLLGDKVPASLKIFLAALAIVDDLIAILVIAVFYSSEIHFTYLATALAIFAALLGLNKLGVRSLAAYLIPGVVIWYLIHHSGVHATIAGVLTALAIPTNEGAQESPLEKLEHALTKPVNFLIMPVFALVNTNIRFEPGMTQGLTEPLGLGILLGLFLGKPLGILLTSRLVVKLGWGTMPRKARWGHLLGLGLLGGIGFTMSIFVALLSFADPHYQLTAKFAILTASVASGLVGYGVLRGMGHRA